MKVILYMTISANGMIAKKGGRATFISKESGESLSNLAKSTRCVIYGKGAFDGEPIEGALNLVLTHDTTLKSDKEKFMFMSGDPKKVLNKVEMHGYTSVLLVGGAKTNKEFIAADLVDEIYFDIEPILLGKGIKIFDDGDFETNLELLETKQLSPNEIQLHYKVVR